MKIKFLNHFLFTVLTGISYHAAAQLQGEKSSIAQMHPIENASAIIAQIETVSFSNSSAPKNSSSNPIQYGILSGSVRQAIPWALDNETKWITAGKNNQVGENVEKVDMQKLIPFLVKAIQEQNQQLLNIEKELNTLREKSTSKMDK